MLKKYLLPIAILAVLILALSACSRAQLDVNATCASHGGVLALDDDGYSGLVCADNYAPSEQDQRWLIYDDKLNKITHRNLTRDEAFDLSD